MPEVFHALGLHLHQPLGNLVSLHNSTEPWEAKQILWCYDRITRMLDQYWDVARLHLSFSGTLLKQLEDPGIRETFSDTVNIAGRPKKWSFVLAFTSNIAPAPSQSLAVMMGVWTYWKPRSSKNRCVAWASVARMRNTAPNVFERARRCAIERRKSRPCPFFCSG